MSGTLNRAAHYQVHERLASGGMGEVYLGTMSSPAGNRPVAVKQVAADHLQLEEAVHRLVAEAKLGFQLRHANICQVLDLVLGDHGAFLILEFVEGMNLRELTKASEGHLDVSVALHAARETARALDYAHRARSGEGNALHTVHGDVTPQNILLSVEGEVKLADFGIARALGTASPGSDVVGGTLGFMAPEVVSGNTDHRSDIYSLGATLHYALVGEPPKSPGDISALHTRSDVSAALKRILGRCLAVRAEERYSSAAEFEGQIALEMARRFPEFTASVVAAKVRATRRAPARASSDVAKTLFTIGISEAPVPLDDGDGPTRVDVPWLRPMEPSSVVGRPLAGAVHQSPATVTLSSQQQAPSLKQVTVTMAGHLVASPGGHATVTMASHVATPPPSQGTLRIEPIPTGPHAKMRRSTLLGVLVVAALVAFVSIVLGRSVGQKETASEAAGLVVADASEERIAVPLPFDAARVLRDAASSVDASTTPDAGPLETVDARAKAQSVKNNRKLRIEARKPDETDPAFITVNSTPWGAVEVDGEIVTQETPLLRHALVPGRHRVTVVFGDGSRSKTRRIRLKSGQRRSLGFVK